ncbi:glycosyl hydrolase [Halolactibacillus sp. JCM 19043]|uniref:glycosyl hydrolase n=1 Tax=Halolactibacillus sp. JCM 19043 TaxID=1460638 RepID=UPI0007840D71|nr:glycosyl hydrolase [Halolactibacillus sp. JCM 19043]
MKRYKRKLMRGMACMMLMLLALQMVLPYVEVQAAPSGQVLDMSDPEASQYTKELFAYLKGLGGDEILFGQQHAIDEGLTLTNDGNRVASDQSEVKNAVGNYPAIFGWDTNSLDGRERPGNAIGDVALSYEERLNNLAASMKKAHELGGIVTLSMHPNNFVTGGNYNDTAGNVVREILPENSQHEAFNAWLDQIVDLSHKVVDENGEAIPIIFRPFHEQTGSWFWWGQSSTTPEDYKAIFRYTVDYLHEHGNHNILIGFSPGSGPSGDKDRYFETYPGDDYVDILGIDSYDNKANAGSEAWINSVAGDLHMLAEEAETRGKVSALTEFGYSAQGMNETGNTLDWWTKVLDGIMNNAAYPKAKETSYMLTWANFGFPNNMYVPYKDVNGDLGGDHELLTDFTKYYEDQRTVFASEANIYNQGIDYTVSDHDMDLFVVGPTNGTKLTTAPTTLRAKVNHGIHPLVTYQASTGEEVEMVLDGNYYTATYTPDALFNNGSVDVTYRYYENDEMIDQESHRYFVTIDELVVKTYDFAENIDGIKTNGTYSDLSGEAPELSLSHSDFNSGMLKLDVTNMEPEAWWQELKLELTDISAVDLTTVNQVEYDVYVPVSAGEKALVNTVMLPPDWETKYSHEVNVHDYDTVTVDGKDYYLVKATVDLPKVETAESLAISLVGKQLTFNDPFFVDNITLKNVYRETVKDPLVVDDFESYMGDDALLDRAYSDNGDPIAISLSESEKQSGDYGLTFDYMLGSAGYAGKQISLGSVDWSEANGVSFWLKHEAQDERHLTVQIQIGGVSFESNVALSDAYEGVVTIPFSEFAPAHWESNQTAIIDSERIQQVTQFALYMGGETGEGTLYFDDIKATDIEAADPVPDKEDNGPVELKPIHFTFDESKEDFSGADFDVKAGHLNGTVNLEGKTEVKRSFGQSLDGYHYIVARIKYDSDQTEANALKAKVFIKTGDDWAWSDSGETTLKRGEYVDVIFDLSTAENLSAVRELGIEFIGASTKDAVVDIDSISIVETLDQLPSEAPGEEEEDSETQAPGEDAEDTETPTPGEDAEINEQTDLTQKQDQPNTWVVNDVKPVINITEEVLSSLDENDWLEINHHTVTVGVPVGMLQGHGDVTFTTKNVTDTLGADLDLISDLVTFTLLDGSGQAIDFDGGRVRLAFNADLSDVAGLDSIKVVYVNDQGEQEALLDPIDIDQENGLVYAEVEHFSSYGVIVVESEEGASAEENVTDESISGEVLPETATSTYNVMFLAVVAVTAAFILFFVERKKRRQSLR